MATSNTAAPTYDPYPFDLPAVIRLFVVGLIVGALGWLLYMAIAQYFITPVFCRTPDSFSVCSNGGTIAWVTAHVIVLMAAVAVLARMAVYRPLLIVLGVLVSLWAAHAWLGEFPWYQALAWQAALFGLALAVFGWIARMGSFVAALLLTIVVAVLARVVLTLA